MSNTPPFPKDGLYALPGAADLRDAHLPPSFFAEGGVDARQEPEPYIQPRAPGRITRLVELSRMSHIAGDSDRPRPDGAFGFLLPVEAHIARRPVQSVVIAFVAGLLLGSAGGR